MVTAGIAHAQVGIGTNNPEPSAILDVFSLDKAILLPRVASVDDIANPVNGMLIYDTFCGCIRGYENGAWSNSLDGKPTKAYPPGSVFCPNTPPTPIVEVVSPTTGRVWMDRNLGALRAATSQNDSASFGYLYQFARFSDGHQCRNSAITTQIANTFDYNLGNPWDGLFINAQASGLTNWLTLTNHSVWGPTNLFGLSPCPIGWYVPSIIEWQNEVNGLSLQNGAQAFASFLKLPASGWRADNGTFPTSANSYYWSHTLPGRDATRRRVLDFSASTLSITTGITRAHGAAVRCIKQ